jgi:glycosyltransferase involved in cell wall biosynthesis
MKIVHVVEPFASGIAVFVKSLVDNLKDDFHIVVHGERSVVMKAVEIKKTFKVNNVQFIRWQSAQREISFKKDFAAFLELYRLLKNLKRENLVDAVHLHSSKSGFIGRLACKLANIKNVVYTPNGAPFLVSPKKIVNFFYKIFEKIGNAFGGKVVCCSVSEWEAYRKLGIKAVNINNGVKMDSASSFHLINKKSSRFRILTCARITFQKNPAFFNEIAKQFEHLDQFEFVWVGDGEERHELTSKNIIVSGWMPAKEAKKLIDTADIYLSTSNFEGLSFSVLEALLLKKPILLRDCIGNKDVVNNGLNGDLFKTTEEAVLKIMQFFNNPGMLPLMGEYSRKFCKEEFDIHSTCKKYRHLYEGKVDNTIRS